MYFEVARAAEYPGGGFDLVTMFDCLHDLGDPLGAARHVRSTLAADGTWMIVEPNASDRVEENLHPIGRAFYGGSTFMCTPNSLSQEVGLALGAQAGEGRIREVALRRRLRILPTRRADSVQPDLRGEAVSVVMQVIQFRLAGLGEAEYRALAERVAPVFSTMPGLLSKVWLADAETNTYGGVYTWRDRASLEQYRASGVYAGLVSNPGLADVSDREFAILARTNTAHGARAYGSLIRSNMSLPSTRWINASIAAARGT